MNHKKSSAIMGFALLLIAFTPSLVKAVDFDPGYLISDSEITDYQALDQTAIQNFLQKRDGTLENYLTFDKEGNPKTAIQAFYEISQNWMINPKYLMILTQKEQSLLEDPNPSQKQYDWATGYGICDNCSMDDPDVQRFKGFYRQVNSAAAQTRYYMDHISEFKYQPGKSYNIDGQSVKIKNIATAGLYNYTPHLHGNQNFWNLWMLYFNKPWPDGTLLVAGDSSSTDVYYIQEGQKRLISSKAVLVSLFDPKLIISAPISDINTYNDGPPIKYLNFSIIKSDTTGNLYMIVGDTKRKFASFDVFKKLGFNDDEIQIVTESELALYDNGADISTYTVYPTGALLQDAKAKKPYEKLYYVLSGEKRPVLTKEILDANFSEMKIKKVSTEELDNFMTGSNIVMPDGMLVKSKTPVKYKLVKGKKVVTNPEVTTVYVISGGKKLPFISGAVLAKMGYSSKNIKLITDETLKLITLGPPLTGN